VAMQQYKRQEEEHERERLRLGYVSPTPGHREQQQGGGRASASPPPPADRHGDRPNSANAKYHSYYAAEQAREDPRDRERRFHYGRHYQSPEEEARARRKQSPPPGQAYASWQSQNEAAVEKIQRNRASRRAAAATTETPEVDDDERYIAQKEAAAAAAAEAAAAAAAAAAKAEAAAAKPPSPEALARRRASIAAAQTNQKWPLPHPSLFRALESGDATSVEKIQGACTRLNKRHWEAGGRGRHCPVLMIVGDLEGVPAEDLDRILGIYRISVLRAARALDAVIMDAGQSTGLVAGPPGDLSPHVYQLGVGPRMAGAGLSKRHTQHVLFTDCLAWGSEAEAKCTLAQTMAGDCHVIVLVVNEAKGAVPLLQECAKRGWPMLPFQGSGGLADQLASGTAAAIQGATVVPVPFHELSPPEIASMLHIYLTVKVCAGPLATSGLV